MPFAVSSMKSMLERREKHSAFPTIGRGTFLMIIFGCAKRSLLREDEEAPLRVNPERAQAFSQGSRRVDNPEGITYFK